MKITTTVLRVEEYEIGVLLNIKIADEYSDTVRTAKNFNTGHTSLKFIEFGDIIPLTFGKYAIQGINITEALLEEHKAERDRENRKAK